MKKIYFFLTVVIAFASCKKDSSIKPDTVTKKLAKIVSVYNNGTPETETYSYDAQGRFTQIVYDNMTEYFVYNSATSFTVTERKNSDNSLLYTLECTQDASGHVTKILFKDAGGTPTGSYEYTYNADGYIIQQKYNALGNNPWDFVKEFFFTNGNVTSYKKYDNGILVSTGDYTYDLNKLNKNPWNYSGNWPSATWFGKGSKNLYTGIKVKDTGNTVIWQLDLAWQLDADDYPTSSTSNYPLTSTQGTDTYTYE